MAAHQRGQDPLGFTQEEHEQRKAVLRAWRAPAGARFNMKDTGKILASALAPPLPRHSDFGVPIAEYPFVVRNQPFAARPFYIPLLNTPVPVVQPGVVIPRRVGRRQLHHLNRRHIKTVTMPATPESTPSNNDADVNMTEKGPDTSSVSLPVDPVDPAKFAGSLSKARNSKRSASAPLGKTIRSTRSAFKKPPARADLIPEPDDLENTRSNDNLEVSPLSSSSSSFNSAFNPYANMPNKKKRTSRGTATAQGNNTTQNINAAAGFGTAPGFGIAQGSNTAQGFNPSPGFGTTSSFGMGQGTNDPQGTGQGPTLHNATHAAAPGSMIAGPPQPMPVIYGLPPDAMARARYNPVLRIYQPEGIWHLIHGLDKDFLGRESHPNRMRYLFDFIATPEGGRAFFERIGSNIDWHRAILANTDRHIEYGQYLLALLAGTILPNPHVVPPNGALDASAGQEVIEGTLGAHQFWHGLYVLELQISEKAMARVDVARRAQPYLSELHGGRTLAADQHDALQALYKQFWEFQKDLVQMMTTYISHVGQSELLGDFLARHRNELWDVWEGGNNGNKANNTYTA